MTYKEQWEKDHPGESWTDNHTCPQDPDGNGIECLCHEFTCIDCWNQEIPGTLPMQYPIDTAAEAELANEPTPMWPKENPHVFTATIAGKNPEDDYNIIFIPADGSYVEILGHRITGDFKTFEGFLEYLKDLEEIKRKYEKLLAEKHEAKNVPAKKEYHVPYPNLTVDVGCIIRDSGDRTEFATGAVRDMREGKGRCDLMPLEVVAKLMCTHNDTTKPDLVTGSIALFKNDGYQNTIHLYNALLYFSERYYNGHADMFLEVAKHFEEGAKKYGENNWQKGIPVHCYIDSAVRHYLKWLRGDKDEPHDRAFVWNLMCCIWEVDYREKEQSNV